MSSKASISLENLFVFNSNYGTTEGEEQEKIFYYYPKEASLDVQIKNVGLTEAIIKFTQTFNPEKPCESMHTQKRRQLFLQPEEDFWMVMTVMVPHTKRIKDGETTDEYFGDEVQDDVFLNILKQAYQMFKLFMGTFQSILKKSDENKLKQRLEHFYSRYLHNLNLNTADLLDVFNGIAFLPLDKNTFLKVNCFINILEATYQQIKCCIFLYNDQLVWSGLGQDDMQILYKYLTTSLFPTFLEAELQGSVTNACRTNVTTFASQHYGRFVTGPLNLHENEHLGKVPRIHVCISSALTECHLVVYRALSASVCMLLDASSQLTMEFYKKLDSYLGPQLTSLASLVADVYSNKTSSISSESQYKFIYFNHMNLAQKSTVHKDKKSGTIGIPADSMKVLADVNVDLERLDLTGEMLLRTSNDYWVIGKHSDERKLYVIISQRNTNLIQVNDELKKLCMSQFSKIFILE